MVVCCDSEFVDYSIPKALHGRRCGCMVRRIGSCSDLSSPRNIFLFLTQTDRFSVGILLIWWSFSWIRNFQVSFCYQCSIECSDSASGRKFNLMLLYQCSLFAELPDRTNGAASLLLPLSTKDRDTKTRDESHKLLNGNSVDPTDRVW